MPGILCHTRLPGICPALDVGKNPIIMGLNFHKPGRVELRIKIQEMKKCNLSCMMDSWTNTGANSFNLDTQSLVLGISSICRRLKSNQCSLADHPALP